MFSNSRISSVEDYFYGVEAGMDSNGRKNRSGELAELLLDNIIRSLSDNIRWFGTGQITANRIETLYGVELGDNFNNRRFDGSIYDSKTKKVYLFEVNNFNSPGSKSKASATEFMELQNRFSKTNHEFIYITDGFVLLSDKSHLKEAMIHIGKVFNFQNG